MSAPIPVFGERPKAVATPKLRALVKFPGNVEATTGISVEKVSGTYTFETNWNDFGSISAIPTAPTSYILTFDTATQAYVLVPSHLLGGAVAGISDAPNDGTQYGRQSGAWTAVTGGGGGGGIADAPSDGTLYGRKNANWLAVPAGIPEAPTTGAQYARQSGAWTTTLTDAPNDGILYGRKSANWIAVPTTGGTASPIDFPSVADAAAAVIPSTATYLRTAGYWAAGDGGGALYKKVGFAPIHAARIHSADGAWWELGDASINVHQFGAKGDGATDDSAPINTAIAYIKLIGGSGNVFPILRFGHPTAYTYRIASPLNFTGFRGLLTTIDFENGTLLGNCTGLPVIDALDSWHIEFKNGFIYGDPTNTPKYGMQLGVGISSPGHQGDNSQLNNMSFRGSYSVACFINLKAEVFRATRCLFVNDHMAGHSVIQDGRNYQNVTSTFFTVTVPVDTFDNYLDNEYDGCVFQQTAGAGKTGYALFLIGGSQGHRFTNCYAACNNNSAIAIWHDHQNLVLDVHCEGTSMPSNVKIIAGSGPVTLQGFKLIAIANMSTTAVITTDLSGNAVNFFDSEIEVNQSATNVPVFATGVMHFHGRIKLADNAYNYDFSQLVSLRGELMMQGFQSALVLPTLRSVVAKSSEVDGSYYYGPHVFKDAVSFKPGASLTAASHLVIPATGNWFYVTGSTNIDSLSLDAAVDEGRILMLMIAGTGVTLKNTTGGKTLLAGDFVSGGNHMITLYCTGSAWAELARCANTAQP